MLKTLATFLLLLPIASLGYAQEEQRQFLKIYPYKISVNDSLCYQVKKGYGRRDTTPWVIKLLTDADQAADRC